MVISESSILYINIFIIALYIVLMYIGYKKGFIYGLVNMLYTLLSILVAWFASPVFAKLYPLFSIGQIDQKYDLLNSFINIDIILNTIIYFIIIFLLLKIIYIFISLLTKAMNKIPVLGKINKFLGLLIGFFNATIIILALSILLSIPVFKNGKDIKDKSLFKIISNYSNKAVTYIADKIVVNNNNNINNNFDIDSYRQQFTDWLLSFNSDE